MIGKPERIPSQIIESLSKEEQSLLNKVLSIEKAQLHIPIIRPNSREEKEIVASLMRLIDEEVKDAN
jgi:hypothetical protein